MSIRLASAFLALFSAVALAGTPAIKTVSRAQIGAAQWPFVREEVELVCRPGKALFVINPATLNQYPLNETAEAQMQRGEVRAQPVQRIQATDPLTHQLKSLSPIRQIAEQLCTTS